MNEQAQELNYYFEKGHLLTFTAQEVLCLTLLSFAYGSRPVYEVLQKHDLRPLGFLNNPSYDVAFEILLRHHQQVFEAICGDSYKDLTEKYKWSFAARVANWVAEFHTKSKQGGDLLIELVANHNKEFSSSAVVSTRLIDAIALTRNLFEKVVHHHFGVVQSDLSFDLAVETSKETGYLYLPFPVNNLKQKVLKMIATGNYVPSIVVKSENTRVFERYGVFKSGQIDLIGSDPDSSVCLLLAAKAIGKAHLEKE
jgi:hypothetical protein